MEAGGLSDAPAPAPRIADAARSASPEAHCRRLHEPGDRHPPAPWYPDREEPRLGADGKGRREKPGAAGRVCGQNRI